MLITTLALASLSIQVQEVPLETLVAEQVLAVDRLHGRTADPFARLFDIPTSSGWDERANAKTDEMLWSGGARAQKALFDLATGDDTELAVKARAQRAILRSDPKNAHGTSDLLRYVDRADGLLAEWIGRALARRGRRLTKAMKRKLLAGDIEQRIRVVRACSAFRNEAKVLMPEMRACLAAGHPELEAWTTWTLGAWTPKSLPLLFDIALDPNTGPRARLMAAEAIEKSFTTHVLDQTRVFDRKWMVEGVRASKSRDLVALDGLPALASLMSDGDARIRELAYFAAYKLGTEAEHLRDLIAAGKDDRSPAVRRIAEQALRRMEGPLEQVRRFGEAIHASALDFPFDDDLRLRFRAREAGYERTLDWAVRSPTFDREVRWMSALALVHDHVRRLEEMAVSDDPDERRKCGDICRGIIKVFGANVDQPSRERRDARERSLIGQYRERRLWLPAIVPYRERLLPESFAPTGDSAGEWRRELEESRDEFLLAFVEGLERRSHREWCLQLFHEHADGAYWAAPFVISVWRHRGYDERGLLADRFWGQPRRGREARRPASLFDTATDVARTVGEKALPLYAEAASDPHELVRLRALKSLAALEGLRNPDQEANENSRRLLEEALDDPDLIVRGVAATSLLVLERGHEKALAVARELGLED